MYTPNLKTAAAKALYMNILHYFFISDDPRYNTLHRYAGKIKVITDSSDKQELTKYFEAETGENISYFKKAQ